MRVTALLLVLAWGLPAAAVAPKDISTDRAEPTVAWIVDGAVEYDQGALDSRCEWIPLEGEPRLPAGLRVLAHQIQRDCGETYVFLDLPAKLGADRRAEYARTDFDGITLEPPRDDPWAGRPAVREAWIDSGGKSHRAIPLDDPDWDASYRLAHGDPVEVLDEQAAVIRTRGGRILAISPWRLGDADPVATQGDPQWRALKDSFLAGRILHEQAAELDWLPAAGQLTEEPRKKKGRPYEFEIDPEWLSGEVYSPEWIDPVGQVLEHACDDRPDDGEPCGAYYLDYTGFGAWWPRRDVDVVALTDGIETVDGRDLPRLKVLVKDPWGRNLRVSPGWAE